MDASRVPRLYMQGPCHGAEIRFSYGGATWDKLSAAPPVHFLQAQSTKFAQIAATRLIAWLNPVQFRYSKTLRLYTKCTETRPPLQRASATRLITPLTLCLSVAWYLHIHNVDDKSTAARRRRAGKEEEGNG